jgi:hypothetical protein
MVIAERATQEPARGMFLPRKRRFVVGVDLGLQADPSAVSIIERIEGVVDLNSESERHGGYGTIPQQRALRYECRYLSRLPLKLPYPDQVARVAELMARTPLRDAVPPAELLVDATGVGLPVAQQFERAGLRPIKVLITGSEDQASFTNGAWHVGKALLVSTLDALLHNGELVFAKALPMAPAMETELKDFRRFVSAAGRSSWEARSGAHDDLVLATGLACWWANRSVGSVGAGWGRY